MPSNEGITIVFGTGGFGRGMGFDDNAIIKDVLDKVYALGVRNIDTAQHYGDGRSESLLGEYGAGKKFIIDTKAYGGSKPGTATEEGIVEEALESLKRLNMEKVDIFYMHAPDPSIPISSTLAGINALYTRSAFARFGLSNYTADQVQEVYDHCQSHGYILPTVYEGHYNPAGRKAETVLLPLLRKLGMSFYAYSPLAGGFLSKSKQDVIDGAGRFDRKTPLGGMMHALYNRPSMVDALADWEKAANEEGVSRAELAYRWVRFNSALKVELGDALIIGARTVDQAVETVQWLQKGPLSEKACTAIDEFWDKMKHEAPLDMMEGVAIYMADMKKKAEMATASS